MSSQSQILSQTAPFETRQMVARSPMPLRIGFSWSLVGWVGYACCQWIMLSVMAKLGSPAVVGRFAFALALSAPVFMLTNLQLRGVQSTDALDEYTFSDYLTLRTISSALAVTFIAVFSYSLRLDHAAIVVIILVSLFKSLESLGDVIAGLMQKFEMLNLASIALLLRGGVGIGSFGIVFAITRNLPISLLVWTCSAGAIIALYDFSVARKLSPSEHGIHLHNRWQILKSLAIISAPLGFVSAVASFNTNIPRYTIERVLGVSDLGIFASLAYPVSAASIVANSLGQSALARLSRLFVERRIKEFEILVWKLVLIGLGLAVFAVAITLAFGPKLLTLIYTPEYAKHEKLFAILGLTAGLNAIGCFLTYALTASRQFKVQLPISLLCMLTTFGLSAFLVPRFKLMGAALALAVSSLIVIIMAGTILKRTTAQIKNSF